MVRSYFGQGFEQGSDDYLYTRDHLGSVREVVASDGTTVGSRLSYDPWGKVTESGSVMSDFTYTGHHYDRPTELSLAWYRGYDPNLGRWLSKDPIGLQGGLNLYGYVQNEPVNWIDPEGKVAWFAAAACLGGGCEALGAAALSAAVWTTATLGAAWAGTELGEWLTNEWYAKGGKQNVRDTGLSGLNDEQVQALYDAASGLEKKRLEKELKGRKKRNKSKRGIGPGQDDDDCR